MVIFRIFKGPPNGSEIFRPEMTRKPEERKNGLKICSVFMMAVSLLVLFCSVPLVDGLSGQQPKGSAPAYKQFQTQTSQSPFGDEIRFNTHPQIYRSKLSDNVKLDCQVENLGSTVITWYKGDRILSAGGIKILDEPRMEIQVQPSRRSSSSRVNSEAGISILIRDVKMDDQDEYTCEVNLKDKPLRITHRLEVLVPPRIHSVTGNGRVTARKGSRVTLNCSASGHPAPKIHWERQHRKYFSSGRLTEQGAILTIANIQRTDEGGYTCVADNLISPPVKATIDLDVLYPPEVRVEIPSVHSGLGGSAQLECMVQANPEPQVNWYKGSMKLSDGERHSMVNIGNRYILNINEVWLADFGNYSCVSQNALGDAKGTKTNVELSGAPTRPEVLSSPLGQHRYNYHLKWRVNSHFPVLRHKIEYWPQPQDSGKYMGSLSSPSASTWPPSINGEPANLRSRLLRPRELDSSAEDGAIIGAPYAYNIKGLQSHTKYLIRVSTENEEGWSRASEVFSFSTSSIENFPKELQSRPGDESNLAAPASSSSQQTSLSSSSISIASSAVEHSSMKRMILVTLLVILSLR